jgi:hypothetical protein
MARPEVRLIYAKVIDCYPYVGSTGFDYLFGHVEIDNLGANTQVSLVYSHKISKQHWHEWQEEAAVCLSPKESKTLYWEFRTQKVELFSPRGTVEFQFIIKYSVNEHIYWDNNGNNNYFLGAGETPHYPPLILPHGCVVLNKARATRASDIGIRFVGSIAVRSVSGKKEIKIVFTTDKWRSIREIYAKYAKALYYGTEIEIWEFSTIVQENTTEIRCAIAYLTEDGIYWDNNFGKDYILKVPGRLD